MKLLQNGVVNHFGATTLFSIRPVSLASSQRWCWRLTHRMVLKQKYLTDQAGPSCSPKCHLSSLFGNCFKEDFILQSGKEYTNCRTEVCCQHCKPNFFLSRNKKTRMHSAAVAVSGVEWVSGLPRGGVCPGGVSAWGRCLPRGRVHPSPCGQNDRRLWKLYLSATTVADGKQK